MIQGRSGFTPKRRALFLRAIGHGLSAEKAANLIGVSRRTVYHWRASDETFRADWDEAADVSTDALEQKLYDMAKDGDVTALIFMLRSRRAEIYNPNLIVRQQMLQLALAKARAELAAGTLTIEGQLAPQPMIYPVEARPEMPRLLGREKAPAEEPEDREAEEDAA